MYLILSSESEVKHSLVVVLSKFQVNKQKRLKNMYHLKKKLSTEGCHS